MRIRARPPIHRAGRFHPAEGGKTVDAKFYPAEGHGFQKRENQIDSVRRLLDWFEK